MFKNTKIISILFISVILVSCGYTKISQKNNLFSFESINIEGNKRIAYTIRNDLILISNTKAQDKYNIEIKLEKSKSNKIKDKAGNVTRYAVNIKSKLVIKNYNNEIIAGKNFSTNVDYDVAENHSDTISNERNATKVATQLSSEKITSYVNLLFLN
tara:strand:+ start:349 stop:819 length:471 start_codon:yes stop_codon:yes gene_type:complete